MPNGAVSRVETMAVGEALKNVVKEVEHAYKSEMKGDEKSPSVLMNAVDIEMNFKNVTVSSSGKLSLSKTNTESSTMEIRLATRFLPPPQQQKEPNGEHDLEVERPRIGGNVVMVGDIRKTKAAVYPEQAKPNRVEGDVVLAADVDKDGKVYKASVIKGPLPLQKAAEAAVMEWEYEPTLLDNEPIPFRQVAIVSFKFTK